MSDPSPRDSPPSERRRERGPRRTPSKTRTETTTSPVSKNRKKKRTPSPYRAPSRPSSPYDAAAPDPREPRDRTTKDGRLKPRKQLTPSPPAPPRLSVARKKKSRDEAPQPLQKKKEEEPLGAPEHTATDFEEQQPAQPQPQPQQMQHMQPPQQLQLPQQQQPGVQLQQPGVQPQQPGLQLQQAAGIRAPAAAPAASAAAAGRGGEDAPLLGAITKQNNRNRPELAGRDPACPDADQTNSYVKFVTIVRQLGVAGLVREYTNAVNAFRQDVVRNTAQQRNVAKNRYHDVACVDETRVVLQDEETGTRGDYIHANFVRGFPLINEFICTQGPLPHTVEDFWRMAWGQQAGFIIMLCENVEQGKKKCESYMPTTKGAALEFGRYRVTTLVVKVEDCLVQTELLLEKMGGEAENNLRKIYHWQWVGWPDRGVPGSTAPLLRMLRDIRGARARTIVHCSAGVGRTGTLVAVEYILQSILAKLPFTLTDAIRTMRRQRAQFVQTPLQYAYIVKAVLREFTVACRGNQEADRIYANFCTELQAFMASPAAAAAAPTGQ